MITTDDLLSWSIPYHPVMDAVRVVVVGLAVIELLWLVRVGVIRPNTDSRSKPFDPNPAFTRYCFQALAGGCLLGITQELAQIHRPMVWWRLPLIIFILLSGLRALRVRL